MHDTIGHRVARLLSGGPPTAREREVARALGCPIDEAMWLTRAGFSRACPALSADEAVRLGAALGVRIHGGRRD